MNRYKNRKSLFITLILLSIVSMSIGYAYITQNLSLNGTANIASNTWNIYFDNIYVEKNNTNVEKDAYITNSKKTSIAFKLNLQEPGEEYVFTTDIINDGTIDAMIENISLVGIPEKYKDVITWDVEYLSGEKIKKCDELLSKTRRKIRVSLSFTRDLTKEQLPSEDSIEDLVFTIDYIQLDDKDCTINTETNKLHYLSIDPDRGIYDGQTDRITIELSENDTYNLKEITRPAYTFNGWTVTPENAYNETSNSIKMGKEDINLQAQWVWHEGYCFSVGNNEYQTLDEAINSISDFGIIKITHENCNITTESGDSIEIPTGKDITIDLNGYNTTGLKNISNNGNLTITNNIKNLSSTYNIVGNDTLTEMVTNNANLVLNNINIESQIPSIVKSTSTSGTLKLKNLNISDKNKDNIQVIKSDTPIVVENVKINIDNSSGEIYGINSTEKYEMKNIDLAMANVSGTKIEGIYTPKAGLFDPTLRNVNVDIKYTEAGDVKAIHSLASIYSKGTINIEQTTTPEVNDTNSANIYAYLSDNPNRIGINMSDVTITMNTKTNMPIAVYSYYSGTFRRDNITINTESGSGSTSSSYGISGHGPIKILNSSIEINGNNVPNVMGISVYAFDQDSYIENTSFNIKALYMGYGVNINSPLHMKDSNIEVSSAIYPHGVYSERVTDITNTNIKINSEFGGYGVFSNKALELNSSIINVSSTRTPPRGASEVNLTGAYLASASTINDTEITVNGNYGEDSSVNELVTAITCSNKNLEFIINKSKLTSSAYGVRIAGEGTTVTIDKDTTINYGFAENNGNGTLVKSE